MMFLCCCDCSADRVSSCVNQLTEQSLSALDDCQSSAPQQITSTSVTVATAKSIPGVCGIGVEASEGSVGSAVYKCPNCHFVTLRGGSILHQCSSSHRAERGESGLPHHQISRHDSSDVSPSACQTVVNIDETMPAGAKYPCPECDYVTHWYSRIVPHCVLNHHAQWQGSGLPLRKISPADVPAVIKRHQRWLQQQVSWQRSRTVASSHTR